MSAEGSTTTETSSTPNLYPDDQPQNVQQPIINNNLDDAEPQPNNEIIQNIVSKLNNNKGGKGKTRKPKTSKRKSRKTRTKKSRTMKRSKKTK
jgi:hypothetical protein